ncbi:MAG: hypothetical protein NPIRA05_20060 [Nitrospirales bacterium]|nr:MAG: hypothetical protein NPIRA05_20060 [Nitrospirales bacterium]
MTTDEVALAFIMKILHLGLLFFAALGTLLGAMYLRGFLADFLTFFFTSYLMMAGTSGGNGVWIMAQIISTAAVLWLLYMLWQDFGKSRFDALLAKSHG